MASHIFECFYSVSLRRNEREGDSQLTIPVPYVTCSFPIASSTSNPFFDTPESQAPNQTSHDFTVISERDLISFCYPDLDEINRKSISTYSSEFYTFTLTDSTGRRLFGFCRRGLPMGYGMRFDVGRRYPFCLCFISRFPFFKVFDILLKFLHSILLTGSSILTPVLSQVYAMPITLYSEGPQTLIIERQDLIGVSQLYTLVIPHLSPTSVDDIPLLPFLQLVRPRVFIQLMAAMMTERRIIVVSSDLRKISIVSGFR